VCADAAVAEKLGKRASRALPRDNDCIFGAGGRLARSLLLNLPEAANQTDFSGSRLYQNRGGAMLHWAAVFFVIALIAALFGFGGIAAGAASIAKVLFVLFIVLAIVALVMGRRAPI
jgi:uncharacterized membrane protein YtjA (UPF0391 family)